MTPEPSGAAAALLARRRRGGRRRRPQRHRRRRHDVTAAAAGSITTAGGPNVSIVGGDQAVAISNRTSAMIDIAQVQGQVHAQSVQKVGELADKNPNETVAIIRSWLHEDAA